MFTSYNFPKLENCIDKQLSQIGNISLVGDRALAAFLARARRLADPERRALRLRAAAPTNPPAMASGSAAAGESDFSVLVLGSDFATDAGAALLTHADREDWHDCLPDLSEAEADACFSDLEELQVVRVQGTDRAGRTIVRVVGKFFPGARIHPVFFIDRPPIFGPGLVCY